MDSPHTRLPFLLAFLLIVCVACSYPSSSISASLSDALAIEVFLSPAGGAMEAVIHKNMVQAGLFEYATILSHSVENLFTYSWFEQNRTTVAPIGIFILVLIFVVSKL